MGKFWRNYGSSMALLGSMAAGGVIGAFWGEGAAVLQPIADIFLNLLYCSVVPLIFVSLVSAVVKMENIAKLKRVLLVMMGCFVVSGIAASVFMAAVCGLFDPAKGAVIAMDREVEDLAGSSNILSMFTVSDFSQLLSRQNLMALMVFAMIFAFALLVSGDKGKPVIELMHGLSEVIIRMIGIIMKLAPLGLGCYFAVLIGENGSQLAGPMSRTVVIYLGAAGIYYLVSNTAFAFIGAGREGIRTFWRAALTPTLTALGTSSSAASIPVSRVAAGTIGIPDDIADVTIPMGAALHKDGACMITVLKIAFMCSMFNEPFFTVGNVILAVVVAVTASTVMGGIPAGGYVGEIFIISAFGFPAVSVPIMVLMGTVTDAPATAVNVAGDIGAAMAISRFVDGKGWSESR